MPVGKHTPRRIPSGATIIKDAKTFVMVEKESMLEVKMGKIKMSNKIAKETINGYR
jgi:hypothetical protein